MSTTDRTAPTTARRVPAPRRAPEETAGTTPAAAGPEPAVLGLPSFVAGAVTLGLVLVHFVPGAPPGAALPVVMAVAAVGMAVAAGWAARAGQSLPAGINGIFAAFWASDAALVLGLQHGWYGVGLEALRRTQETFLIAWIVVIGLLLIGTLRLPAAWTAVFALVEGAFVLNLLGTVRDSTTLTRTAGWLVLGAAAIGSYAYLSVLDTLSAQRQRLPLGPAVLR